MSAEAMIIQSESKGLHSLTQLSFPTFSCPSLKELAKKIGNALAIPFLAVKAFAEKAFSSKPQQQARLSPQNVTKVSGQIRGDDQIRGNDTQKYGKETEGDTEVEFQKKLEAARLTLKIPKEQEKQSALVSPTQNSSPKIHSSTSTVVSTSRVAKPVKSISPNSAQLTSNWDVPDNILTNPKTLKNVMDIRRGSYEKTRQAGREAREKQEKINAILTPPLSHSEFRKAEKMKGGTFSERSHIVKQARLPEIKAHWADIIKRTENIKDLAEWCYLNNVDFTNLMFWIEYNPKA